MIKWEELKVRSNLALINKKKDNSVLFMSINKLKQVFYIVNLVYEKFWRRFFWRLIYQILYIFIYLF